MLSKLLHCSEYGTELGWLVDPMEEMVLVVLPEQRVKLLRGDRVLPVMEGLDLQVTATQMFEWLVF